MTIEKKDFPLVDIRQHLETAPIVLVNSRWQGRANIMTMGWHTMLQFSPDAILWLHGNKISASEARILRRPHLHVRHLHRRTVIFWLNQ